MKVTKEQYIANMEVGNVVAFTVETEQGLKMLSGRVMKITNNHCTIQTKNGSVFFPNKSNIVWVKTGTKWPLGIYNALKYTNGGKHNG